MADRYNVTVNLIPFDYPTTNLEEEGWLDMQGHIHHFRQTVAYSFDDAINLLTGPWAGSQSRLKFWQPNRHSLQTRLQVDGFDGQVEICHIDNYPVSLLDVVNELPKGSGEYAKRELEEIRTATIHHTVTWNHGLSDMANVAAIARYHAFTQNWPGIAYHYVVAPSGAVFRTNNMETVSYHAGSFAAPGDENQFSFGIALGGDFREQEPNYGQLTAARAILSRHRMRSKGHIALQGHKHMPGASTACPGEFLVHHFPFINGDN